ncbi:hypothetical protein ACRAWD_02010 [Caulobacter segnis]
MKGLDGIEFVNPRFRRSPDGPNPFCPIVMITGHSTERRVHEARDAGVNEFLGQAGHRARRRPPPEPADRESPLVRPQVARPMSAPTAAAATTRATRSDRRRDEDRGGDLCGRLPRGIEAHASGLGSHGAAIRRGDFKPFAR